MINLFSFVFNKKLTDERVASKSSVLYVFPECEKNTYKDKAGNERCLPCPKNSISNDNQQGCSCEENHFRFIGENYTSPCYGKWSVLIFFYIEQFASDDLNIF